MQTGSTPGRKLLELGIKLLVTIACAALAAMMFLMAFDVVGRYFFNAPIPGGLEMVEYFMAIIVPLSVAFCAIERSHVSVDLVADRLPRSIRKVLGVFVSILSIVFVGLISWQNFAYIGEIYHSNLTSAVLKIPAYPFVAATAVGMLVYTLVLVVHLFTKNK